MDQIAEAVQHGDGPGTGQLARSLLERAWLTVSRFCSVHTEESFYRFTRNIYIIRRSCHRRGSGGDVDISGRRYWRSVIDLFHSTTKHADH
jgi:hypothetical protein